MTDTIETSFTEIGVRPHVDLKAELHRITDRGIRGWISITRHIYTHYHNELGEEIGDVSWASRLIVYCQVIDDALPILPLEVYEGHDLDLSDSAKAILGSMAIERFEHGDFETVHEHVYPPNNPEILVG